MSNSKSKTKNYLTPSVYKRHNQLSLGERTKVNSNSARKSVQF